MSEKTTSEQWHDPGFLGQVASYIGAQPDLVALVKHIPPVGPNKPLIHYILFHGSVDLLAQRQASDITLAVFDISPGHAYLFWADKHAAEGYQEEVIPFHAHVISQSTTRIRLDEQHTILATHPAVSFFNLLTHKIEDPRPVLHKALELEGLCTYLRTAVRVKDINILYEWFRVVNEFIPYLSSKEYQAFAKELFNLTGISLNEQLAFVRRFIDPNYT